MQLWDLRGSLKEGDDFSNFELKLHVYRYDENVTSFNMDI